MVSEVKRLDFDCSVPGKPLACGGGGKPSAATLLSGREGVSGKGYTHWTTSCNDFLRNALIVWDNFLYIYIKNLSK